MEQGFLITSSSMVEPSEVYSGFLSAWFLRDSELFHIVEKNGASREEDAGLPGGYAIPLIWQEELPEAGTYRITCDIGPVDKSADVLVFSSRRRLSFKGKLAKRTTVTFLADATPVIPRGSDKPSDHLFMDVSFINAGVFSVSIKEERHPRIFIAGDSTVCDQSADVPYAPGATYAGWGQMLPFFTRDNVVSNHAHSGLTTEAFRTEGHCALMSRFVGKGDIVLLQFGHNDQKLERLAPKKGYRDNMLDFIGSFRSLGTSPVLVTPLSRNTFRPDGTYNDLLAPWAEECHVIGEDAKVPVIDLHRFSMDAIIQDGLEGAKKYFHPGDYTHTNDYGAYRAASYVASCLDVEAQETSAPWTPRPVVPLPVPEGVSLPPELDTLKSLHCMLSDSSPLLRHDLFSLLTTYLRFVPMNVYNDHYKDVEGHETYAGVFESAFMSGIIPPSFVIDGCVMPERVVTVAEFYECLYLALSARRKMEKGRPLEVFSRNGIYDGRNAGETCSRAYAASVLLRIDEHEED